MSFRWNNLGRLTRQGVSVSLPTDENGFIGRECPVNECQGVFKIRLGTGLDGDGLPCHCAYCGHTAGHDHFYTQEQLEYGRSVALRQVTEAVRRDLKSLEFEIKPPRRGFGIGLSMEVKPGRPIPLHRIREPTLETEITCDDCGLDYAVFGLFAYCPDCRVHNSTQILARNLALVRKQLQLAADQEDEELGRHLIEDALENCVSAFDGFGREIVSAHADKSSNPSRCERISFQNLARAASELQAVFGIDLAAPVSSADWKSLELAFMQRHLLAHRSGVIDQKYLDETGEPAPLLGRRLSVEASAVEQLSGKLEVLGANLASELAKLP